MEPCTNLSSDVLLEIFTRLNLNTLRKCRLLSRECNSLTYESSFMRLHCQRSKTIAGYFVQSLKYSKFHSSFISIDNPDRDPQHFLNLNFLPDANRCYFEILATVDQGLMFCMTNYPDDCYYICKPSTKQWEVVPSPNPATFTTIFGMVVLSSNPLQFKIIRLSEYSDNKPNNLRFQIIRLSDDDQSSDSDSDSEDDLTKRVIWEENKCFHCEIFDSRTWSWKQLNDVMLPYFELFETQKPISAYGGLHWLTINEKNHRILSFYEEEKWELDPLPDLFRSDHCHSVTLTEYEGKLALICKRPEPNFNIVDFWVMKDHFGERLWCKRQTVDLKALDHPSPNSFCNADTLFMTSFYRAIFYNFKNGKFDQKELGHKLTSFADSAFFFQTNYEPIQLKQCNTRIHSVFKCLTISSEFIVLGAFLLVFMLLFILDV